MPRRALLGTPAERLGVTVQLIAAERARSR
jgi:hypothetical protein